MVLDENCETLPALHRKIISDNLKYAFPNVDIAPNSVHVHDGIVNNLTGERRSTMEQQRFELAFERVPLVEQELPTLRRT